MVSSENIVPKAWSNKVFNRSTVGFCIKSKKHGCICSNKNKLLYPASALKVLTAALGFEKLEAKAPFQTFVGHTGTIKDNRIKGDLVIKGFSDPTFGSDRFGGIDKAVQSLLDPLTSLTIQSIEGDIVLDTAHFEKALAVPSWSYEDLGNYYGAGASSINIHENIYNIVFRLGRSVGEQACLLKIIPNIQGLIVNDFVKTGIKNSGDQAFIFGKEFDSTIFVRGSLPIGQKTFTIKGSIPDPFKFFISEIEKGLKRLNIASKGQVVLSDKNISKPVTWLKKQNSQDYQEIASIMLDKSINLYAEAILKNSGYVESGFGSTGTGLQSFTNFLISLGIDSDEFELYDGSGLSLKNLITPKAMVQALELLKNKPYFPAFLKSLPRGSKYAFLRDLPRSLQDRIYIKSGSNSQSLSYAGYFENSKGHLEPFCFIGEHITKEKKSLRSFVRDVFINLDR